MTVGTIQIHFLKFIAVHALPCWKYMYMYTLPRSFCEESRHYSQYLLLYVLKAKHPAVSSKISQKVTETLMMMHHAHVNLLSVK